MTRLAYLRSRRRKQPPVGMTRPDLDELFEHAHGIVGIVHRIVRRRWFPGPAVHAIILWDDPQPKREGRMITLPADSADRHLSLAYFDARGNEAPVDAPPVWTSSAVNLLTVTADADGMGATVHAVGPLGTAQLTVTADADIGDGTRELIGLEDVVIVAGEAVVARISLDPEAAPTPPTP